MNESSVHYGEVLKKLVKSKGFSPNDLSKKLNMTTQGVYNIFRTKSPRVDVMIAVTRAIGLEFSTWELLQDVEKLKKHASNSNEFIDSKIDYQTQEFTEQVEIITERFEKIHDRLEKKLDEFEDCMINAREVIQAKDELIKYLKEHQGSVS